MNAQVAAPPVVAKWLGLNANFLANGGLEITTDYRNILGKILLKRTTNTDLNTVFPGHVYQPVGIIIQGADV